MKLFYAAGACSIGIHVLMEEIGAPYEAMAISLRDGEQSGPGFIARNPKAKVPLLERDDGTTLTEYGAISRFLAAGTAFAPVGLEAECRAMEAIDYIVGTIHMQGFARIFRTGNFTPHAADELWVKTRGREIIGRGFELMAERLGSAEYLQGAFGAADCALFYVEYWAGRVGIDLPPALAAHLARMRARPAVARVMAAEGLA